MAVAALLLAVAILVGYLLWRHPQTATVPNTGMAAATVLASAPEGDQLRLTLRYDAHGRLLETSGTVSSAAFTQQGKIVWVCFNPAAPSETVLRLPMDPLCAQGG